MKRFTFHLLLAFSVSPCLCVSSSSAAEKPNVVFLLCDNLGYGDVGPFGNTVHRTPNLDRMAAEGRKFTHYYSASGVCSPSRAALMTGCYPLRIGLHRGGDDSAVLRPIDPLGIAADEFTLAELFQTQGYATKAIGKWHLGDQPMHLPTRHGFTEYLGIPYSEDMVGGKKPGWPPLPLLQNEQVIVAPVDRDTLTERYTKEAVAFIEQNRERPFFLYFPHAVPGSEAKSFASAAFREQSQNGRYGDAVEEMDWSVGQILQKLHELKIDDRTIVVWTNDNGAVKREPRQGSNAPLRGWGYSTDEGGMRVPMLVRGPCRIPAGTECAELTTMMDWLPTFATLLEVQLAGDRPIDGRDIGPLLYGKPDAMSPHTAFYYYQKNQLQAVRAGKWKLYLPLAQYIKNASPEKSPRPPSLFDLVADVDEQHDLLGRHPEIVAELTRLAEAAREEIGDGSRVGRGVRKPGWVEHPVPQVLR